MARVLLSFLGTGNYQPIRYRLDGRVSDAVEFVQVALHKFLLEEPLTVCILETKEARNKHGDALRRRLPPDTRYLDIPEGASEGELWAVYSKIGEAVQENADVVFDCTHGYRSLAITGAMAINWLRAARGVRLERALYGAYEARQGDVAPVFDLTAMFELPSWAEAVSEWRRTARTSGLVERSAPYLKNLRRTLRQDAPRALVGLPDALALLDAALRTLRTDRLAEQAEKVSALIGEAIGHVGAHPSLTPLGESLEALRSSIAGLLARGADAREPSHEYLEHQVQVARWYLDHGDVVEAYSVLRECLTSAAVRCVRLAGIENLEDRDGEVQTWHKSKYRAAAEYLLECAVRSEQPGRNPAAYATLRQWLSARPFVAESYQKAVEAVRDKRNKINHCWTGDDHAREGMGRGFLEQQVDGARKASNLIEQLIQLIPRAT